MQKPLHDVMASMLKNIAINVMECLEVTENWVDPSQVNLSMASLFTIDFLRLDRECLTHLHSERPKEAWPFWQYFTYKSIFLKTFEGEMLIRSQTTTFLQIFCELSLYSKVIIKSMRVADDTF